jgi:hypothetical protein
LRTEVRRKPDPLRRCAGEEESVREGDLPALVGV